ncbi:MAG: site-2 protease family protein [Candidatus Blackburnbacteria bacterium]|nr:site-2 protease family protein [Candidatus Blackburnbacteria bacterium]
MLDILFTDQQRFLFWIAALLVAITVHEFSHALAADRLGDPTPRVQKRLTLNPLSHLDPLGTLMLFLVGFGWGRPVQFDPYNLANPRRDAAVISFAGPLSNIILATALSLIVRFSWGLDTTPLLLFKFLLPIIYLNVLLAVFNLLPIHPLDGGKIFVGLLSAESAGKWDRFLNQYGLMLLLFILLPLFGGASLVGIIIGPTVNFILSILLPSQGIFI